MILFTRNLTCFYLWYGKRNANPRLFWKVQEFKGK